MRARRVLRAFALALWRTARGELPPEDPFERWRQTAGGQLTAIEDLAAREGIAPDELKVRVDRRDVSMQLILAALRFHLDDEFPQLRRRFGDECLTVLRAICLDDSHRLQKLADCPQLPPELRARVQALAQHLLQLPPPEPR